MAPATTLNNRDEVIVAKFAASGGIYSAAPSTPAPSLDVITALPTGFENLGFIGPDAVVRTMDTQSRNIMAASGVKVKSVITGKDVTYSLTFLQTNAAVMREVFGPGNVTVAADGSIQVTHNAKDMPVRSFAFDLVAGEDYIREYVPAGQVTSVGDVTLGGEEELSYQVTIECSDDAKGNKAYTVIAKGAGLASMDAAA